MRCPHRRPVVVALDGHSGAGKSCLATALALRAGGTVLEGDDFYQPALASLAPDDRNRMSAAEAAEIVIDWRRLRSEALEPLARGEAARFRPYDWDARDGRLAEPRLLRAGDVVVVDGVYSARSELADLVDLAVLVETDRGDPRRPAGSAEGRRPRLGGLLGARRAALLPLRATPEQLRRPHRALRMTHQIGGVGRSRLRTEPLVPAPSGV